MILSLLADVGPMLHFTFEGKILKPGPSVSLQCAASGNPPPDIKWMLDDLPIHASGHVHIVDGEDNEGIKVSHLNLTVTTTRDAGEYKCLAINRAGKVHHAARIDIEG